MAPSAVVCDERPASVATRKYLLTDVASLRANRRKPATVDERFFPRQAFQISSLRILPYASFRAGPWRRLLSEFLLDIRKNRVEDCQLVFKNVVLTGEN